MVFRAEVAEKTIEGYHVITDYFSDVRRFYEIVGTRLAVGEYGVSLTSVTGDRRLFSSVDSYGLPGESAGHGPAAPGSCPSYVWFPTWLGSFYTAHSAPAGPPAPMAFVWTWVGLDDAFVAPVSTPECWIGITTFDDDRPLGDLALQTWRFFRVEWTFETKIDEWLSGGFQKNHLGCDISGRWHLRRISLDKLKSYYEVETMVVRPLSEKFLEQRDGL